MGAPKTLTKNEKSLILMANGSRLLIPFVGDNKRTCQKGTGRGKGGDCEKIQTLDARKIGKHFVETEEFQIVDLIVVLDQEDLFSRYLQLHRGIKKSIQVVSLEFDLFGHNVRNKETKRSREREEACILDKDALWGVKGTV